MTTSAAATSSANTAAEDSHEGIHLVVLHHGMWGHAGHVKFVEKQFKQRLGDRLCVYRARANETKFTYDGIDLCAVRLVEEIHEVIKVIEEGGSIEDMKGLKKSKKKQPAQPHKSTTSKRPAPSRTSSSSKHKRKVTQFSFMGYSLGGLIGRFAMGLLEMERFFSPIHQGGRGIEPVYFVTMATPHLGIRMPYKSPYSRLFNYLSARILSRTGEQLQLTDSYIPAYDQQHQEHHDDQEDHPSHQHHNHHHHHHAQSGSGGSGGSGGGVPILVAMSEPCSVFVQALARFKKRAIYCNIRNDRSVPFWSASFSDADPFNDLDTLNIQYNSKYSSLIESFEHWEQALQDEASDASDLDSDIDSTVADSGYQPGGSIRTANTADDAQRQTQQQQQRQQRQQRKHGKKAKDARSIKEDTACHRRLLKWIKGIRWQRYFLAGVVVPIVLPMWIVILSSAIAYQGIGSRYRTKSMLNDQDKIKELEAIRQAVIEARRKWHDEQKAQKDVSSDNNEGAEEEEEEEEEPLSTSSSRSASLQTLLPAPSAAASTVMVGMEPDHNVVIEQQQQQGQYDNEDATALAGKAVATETTTRSATAIKGSRPQDTQDSLLTLNEVEPVAAVETVHNNNDKQHSGGRDKSKVKVEEEEVSFCYPHFKSVRPLDLVPAQKEISRHLNELEWIKNILHIDAFNAHASIVIRERRFTNDGGVAAVQHVVDMFKQDDEDE